MATRKIKDAKDLSTQELIYFKGHAKATFMSDGATVEDAVRAVENATYKNKGYFPTLAELQSAFPKGSAGSRAYVGSTYPYSIYLWQNGAWVDSGATGGDESVDLASYYTKSETDTKLTELSDEINNIAQPANQFNVSEVRRGGMYTTQGAWLENSYFVSSNFIPAKANDNILVKWEVVETAAAAGQLATFKEDKITPAEGGRGNVIYSAGEYQFVVPEHWTETRYITIGLAVEIDLSKVQVIINGDTTIRLNPSVKVSKSAVEGLEEALSEKQPKLTEGDNVTIVDDVISVSESLGQYQGNIEYIRVIVDADGRFLWGIKRDGSVEFAKGIPTPIRQRLEQVEAELNNVSFFELKDIPEYLQVTLDTDGRLISYIDREGVQHFTKVDVKEITTDNIIYKGKELIPASEVAMTDSEYVYCERPRFGEIHLYGELPTDTSDDRTPTDMVVEFGVEGKKIFKANAQLSIQGHGTAESIKHNWTIDLFNSNGDELAVKFGNMPALDSFHLKGYYTDRTQARGVGGAAIWRDLVGKLGYPYGKVNNKPLNISDGQKIDSIYCADARYREDGFPVVMYHNGEFYGLYTIKTKKHRKNYGMQKAVKDEIFLDSITYTAFLNEPFNYADWELKNPKLDGYDEGMPITDASVSANINRLFSFLNNISTEADNHADYIVLPHWIAYFIFSELVGNSDINGNNMNILTWDGTHWSIVPYDLDVSLGLHTWDEHYIEPSMTGLITTGIAFFRNFYNAYKDDIISMYRKFREMGFISEDNLYGYYVRQVESIPREVYELDLERWENNWSNGIPTLEQIYNYLHSRIEYLDSLWLV